VSYRIVSRIEFTNEYGRGTKNQSVGPKKRQERIDKTADHKPTVLSNYYTVSKKTS